MYNTSIDIEKSVKMRKNLWFHEMYGLMLAFIIPVVIMFLILIQRKIFPFGENSFMRTDMYHQYVPFFSEFRHKLTTGQSLLYSWDVGMGINFSALYAYYLASPLNWLVVLCPKNSIIEFMTGMIIFKIGLCGLSFAYYLRKHSKTPSFSIAFFGIFYALSGYMAAYSWNVMWLDCIVLFPIVCLGLENIVNGKSGILYVISLGLCICSNYYISIMICVFMIVYSLILTVMRGKQGFASFIKSAFKFALYSLLAGTVAGAILLPEIYALEHTASGEFNFPDVFNSYFPIIDMLARHMGNVETEIGLDHWPNIYCGVAVYIFFILYLNNPKIKLKEKAVYVTAVIFMLAGFSVNVLDYIWHGLHFPNSLPARQSFIYIFIILYMMYRAYENLEANTVKQVGQAVLISLGFILLCQKLVPEEENIHFTVYYLAMLFTAVYALLIYLGKQRLIHPNMLWFFAFAAVSIEAAINTATTSVATTSRTAYTDDNADISKLLSDIRAQDREFYRFDKVNKKTKNDGAWLNYHSASIFSSTANADLTEFFRRVGCEGSTNAYSINGATPLMDSLFSIKYAFYPEQPNNPHLKYVAVEGSTYLYENPYILPLAYMLPDGFEDNWLLDKPNPAEVQNDMAEVLQTKPVLERINGENAGSAFTFRPDIKGSYYVYVNNKNIKDIEVKSLNGAEPKEFSDVNRGYLIELGSLDVSDEITLSTDETEKIVDAVAYRFNYEALAEIYQQFSKNPMIITKYTSNRISGKINAAKDGIMMTSIPYDKGWKIQVDGKPQSARKGYEAFISLNLSAGEHIIDMVYEPEGFRTGWIATIISLVIIIGIIAGKQLLKRFSSKGNALITEEDKQYYESSIQLSDDEDNEIEIIDFDEIDKK